MEYILAFLTVFDKIIGTGINRIDLIYFFSGLILLWYLFSKRAEIRTIALVGGFTALYAALVHLITGSADYVSSLIFVLHIVLNTTFTLWIISSLKKMDITTYLTGVAALFGVSTIAALVLRDSFLWKPQEYTSGFGPYRLKLFYTEPAYLSIVCGIMLILCVYQMLAATFRWRLAASGLVFVVCMVLSYGMGGLIATALALLILLMVHVARNRNEILQDSLKRMGWSIAAVILIIIVVAIVALSPIYGIRIMPLIRGEDNGIAYTITRPYHWFVEVMNRTNWHGAGINQLVDTPLGDDLGIVEEFKNSFVKLMAEGGILGMIAVAVLVILLLGQCLLYGNELAAALTIFTLLIQFSTGSFEDPIHWLVYGVILHECFAERDARRALKVPSTSSNDDLLDKQEYAAFDGRKGSGDASDGQKLKICLVGSSGGHLTHLYMLKPFWGNKERFWVTFDKQDARSLLKDERMIPCYYPTNRSIKGLIINTVLAFRVLRKERPDVIISSGAAVAVPFFYLGKVFGAKCIYIEVYDRIDKPTVSGKIVYPISDKFIVQWEEMKKVYPNSINLGSIF
jgi:hypothetical protein